MKAQTAHRKAEGVHTVTAMDMKSLIHLLMDASCALALVTSASACD